MGLSLVVVLSLRVFAVHEPKSSPRITSLPWTICRKALWRVRRRHRLPTPTPATSEKWNVVTSNRRRGATIVEAAVVTRLLPEVVNPQAAEGLV
jgi:hypothetical protein